MFSYRLSLSGEFITQQAIIFLEMISVDADSLKQKENMLDKHVLAVSLWTAWKDGQEKSVDWTLDSGSLPPGLTSPAFYSQL